MTDLGVAAGKVIATLACDADSLRFTFHDGTGLRVWDDGQSCCEQRYMTTDDGLAPFVGATLLGMEVRDGGDVSEEEYDTHDVEFLVVSTSQGSFTVASHNEHNGYYGGFDLTLTHEPNGGSGEG